MNFDAMSRAGAAGRIALTETAAAMMGGIPAGQLIVRDGTITDPKSKKSMSFADIVKSGKITKTFTRRRPQGDQAEDAGPVHHDRCFGSAARHPVEDQRHREIRHRRHAAGHGLRQGRDPAGALRRHGQDGRRQRGQEGAGLHQGRHARRQDEHRPPDGWLRWPRRLPARPRPPTALKVTYDNGPNAKLSSESLLAEAKRLQGLDDSGLFFVKDGDTAAALGIGGEGAGGGIHHQHQHPCADGADDGGRRAEGRHLARLHRQPVCDTLRRDRGRCGRGRSRSSS